MSKIIFISGACGCGKTTFANAYAKHLVGLKHKTLYIIHGDDFHSGFVETEEKGDFFVDGQASDQVLWEDILRFNWDCIMATAQRALQDNLDVIIDYVIENELPRVRELAEKNRASLYYIVLTADEDVIEERIRNRGDTDMINRALFLKKSLKQCLRIRGTSATIPEKRLKISFVRLILNSTESCNKYIAKTEVFL